MANALTRVPRSKAGVITRSATWMPLSSGVALAAYVLSVYDKGWLPHDDGYLAWAARETLQGNMPHRDFHEVYTGGLSYLNAWAFHVFGETLLALRIPYLILLAAFGAVLYLIARRFLSRVSSSLAVGSVLLLGPFLTPTPMPTLYNLFCATFALYLTLRFLEGGCYWWLAAAGLVTGLSVLVKVTGLYAMMAIPLGLIAHHASRRKEGPDTVSRMLLAGAAIAPTILISRDFSVSRLVGLLLPIYIVIWFIWRLRSTVDSNVPASPLSDMAVFGLAAAIPITLFAGAYAANGALPSLVSGVIGAASAIVDEAGFDPSPLTTLAYPVGLIAVGALFTRISRGWREINVVIVIAAGVLLSYALAPQAVLEGIHVVTRWVILIACVGYVVLATRRDESEALDSRLLTLAAVAICFQLVQFPSSNEWQIAYTVPLAGVLGFVLLSRLDRRTFVMSTAVIASFALVFGLARHQGQIFASSRVGLQVPFVELDSEQGGIQVPLVHAYYNDLVAAVSATPESEQLMAGPDSPEIYFLTDRQGSYPGVFALMDARIDPGYSMIDEYASHRPGVVVVNHDPANSTLEKDWVARVRQDCELDLLAGTFEVYSKCGP